MEEYFEIGQIVNTNGLKGFVKIKPFTDDITKFKNFKKVYIQRKNELEEFCIEDVKFIKNMVLLKLKGIDSIEEAENFRNYYIKVKREDEEPLEENTYYIVDLIGCEVQEESGNVLGKLIEIFSTGSNDVYVIKDDLGKQVLIPAISEVVKNIDVENKKIVVKLLEGLLWE